jgi:hypothetical protein
MSVKKWMGVALIGCMAGASCSTPQPENRESSSSQRSLTGASASQPSTKKQAPLKREPAADQSLLTVYSKPYGTILVGGKFTDQRTPATVEIAVDDVNVITVQFDDGSVSSPKEVTGEARKRFKVFVRKKE